MKSIEYRIKEELSVVLCGEAGQGIQTVESLLTRLCKSSGYNVFATKELMSRIRGGMNSTTIRIASHKVSAPVNRMDILIPLTKNAIEHVKQRISEKTIIFLDQGKMETSYLHIEMPFSKIASELGSKIYANIVAIGALSGLLNIEQDLLSNILTERFHEKGEKVIQNNIKAASAGYKMGAKLIQENKVHINITPHTKVKEEIVFSGTDAVGMGALAGGCNFIASYPMTPATGVLTFLAQHGRDFDVIAEQSEDEISAMNMAIGAWYAGARAMVSTSGGGFDLMTEGLSLAAKQESPMVILIGQRPGPATGLPTRTEQADLELALYAGHGEFPRIILAPGTLEQAVQLTWKAFDLADLYQVPVFILMDQYFLDSYYNLPSFDMSQYTVENHIIKTTPDYQRYKLTVSGISPRGIPGNGEGIVCADCHTHDEDGHITEDLSLRTSMVDKILKKTRLIEKNTLPPLLKTEKNYTTLVICWGSNYHVVREAIERIEKKDIALLHFCQVYPLHPDTAKYLSDAKNTVIVENNATSQFGKLIKLHTGHDIKHKILKYNGLPFSVEEVQKRIEEVL